MEIKTFYDLYNFLINYARTNDSIIEWLKDNWQGKDKQESVLRLFSYLNLINKLDNFTLCKGNFNLATIKELKSLKDIFIDKMGQYIYLKDKGDSSDLSGQNKKDPYNILATTSKNIEQLYINKLDIEKIVFNFQKFKDADKMYKLTLCIVIRKIDDFYNMLKRINDSNKFLKEFLLTIDLIIIDHNDLNTAFKLFKNNFYLKIIFI
jgi:hypothetical protein